MVFCHTRNRIVIILVTVNQLSSIYIMSVETFLLILTESGNDFENNERALCILFLEDLYMIYTFPGPWHVLPGNFCSRVGPTCNSGV